MNVLLMRSKALLIAVLALGPGHAQPSPEVLNSILTNHQNSVLFLGGTIKFLCGRCDKEHPFPVSSTVVVADAKGLFLATATAPLVNPQTQIRDSTLHVRMPNDAEVPVRLAVMDRDLGLMVLALLKPADAQTHPLTALSLDSPARARVLDDLVLLRRHDASTGYALSASALPIQAIETKPRLMYYSAGGTSQQGISPCFDAQGRLVALATTRQGAVATDEVADLVAQARTRPPE
jgi:hypothetical protein